MEKNPLVIIHGWSDHFNSFVKLARLLQQALHRKPKLINLANYISMDDEVTFDDIVAAMMQAWQQEKLPTHPYCVDVVVHSTGGLIIRYWLSKHFTAKTSPIKHLVMLAPANFGSHLAHCGQAFYGRIIKGLTSKKLFNVGAKLLKGLELASPFTWHLALQDRFGRENYYGTNKILTTVLIGDTGYRGIAAAANSPGTDGTVSIACANMNCAYLQADFSQNPMKPSYSLRLSKGNVAFGIMSGENHATIAAKDGGFQNANTLKNIITALTVTDRHFKRWCQKLKAQHHNKIGWQNTVTWVHDQFDFHINDYFIEFFETICNDGRFEELFYQDVITSIHAYESDKSYRAIKIDCSKITEALTKNLQHLNVSLTATPEFSHKSNVVGYQTFDKEGIGAIAIPKREIKDLFVANRTLMIELILQRQQSNAVFEFKKLAR